MALALVTTKLTAPRPPQSAVERARLYRRLESGLGAKLILVSAPAGAGKSTLLGGWLSRLERPSAWLSLERADDDPERFLVYLVSALQRLEPAIGSGLLAALNHGAVQGEALVIRLVNDLSRFDQDALLVLDDYHLLSSERIHELVKFLLDHLPPRLCLVIASRSDPPLALSRLRAQGQMLEVRADDLRFSQEEIGALLNTRLGLGLSPTAITSLEARTDGWAAALQLAAVSLAGRPDREDKEAFVRAFAGSHRYLVSYLVDEVLSKQSEAVRRFLERTSVLGRFTASLCQSVSEQPASRDVLEHLLRSNLFVIALDDEGVWYRYHHLFAEFLQHALREREAERVPELHKRASHWLEQHSWSDEAIQHAFLANDDALAARLIEAVAFDLGVYWKNKQLIDYVQKLPASLLPFYPRLCIHYSWSLTNTGQLSTLKSVLPLLQESRAHSQQPHTVAACVTTLSAYERLRQLDFAGTTELCQQALKQLEPLSEPLSNEERWGLVAATNLTAYSYLYSDLARADEVYPTVIERSLQFGNPVGVANSFARWGRVKHQLGQLHAAKDVFRRGLSALGRWEKTVVNVGELHLNLARLLYEWNRLGEAESYLEQARRLNESSRFIPVMALELKISFYLYQARGERGAAYALLSKLDDLTAEVHPDNLFYKQLLGVMAMELRLSLVGLLPALEYLLSEVDVWTRSRKLAAEDSLRYFDEGSYYLLARVLTAQGRAAEALPLLLRLAQAAETEGRMEDLVRSLTLQALAHQSLAHQSLAHGSAQEELALTALQRALHLAEPEGYCRSFVDQGPPLRTLLEQLSRRQSTPRTPYIAGLLAAFSGSASPTEPKSGSAPFSERERSVLRLLAAGNSHKQIAKELGLSPNTVRWYMQSLYAKLQVSNRTEAVNRARDVGLL